MSEWLVGRSIARKFYILINCSNNSNTQTPPPTPTHTFVEAHLNFNSNLYWKFHSSPCLYASLYHQYSHRHTRLRGDCGAVCTGVFFSISIFLSVVLTIRCEVFFLTAHFSLARLLCVRCVFIDIDMLLFCFACLFTFSGVCAISKRSWTNNFDWSIDRSMCVCVCVLAGFALENSCECSLNRSCLLCR